MSAQDQTSRDQTVAPVSDGRLATDTLLNTLIALGQFQRFVQMLRRTEWDNNLQGEAHYTVLAPTDAVLPSEVAEGEDREQMDLFVRKHLLKAEFRESDMRLARSVKTLGGESLDVRREQGRVQVGGATLVRADVVCTNGVLHVLDRALA